MNTSITDNNVSKSRIAVVTGGASGMGRIYARRLAADGFHVAIMDVNEQGLNETADAVGGFSCFVCDISKDSSVLASFAEIQNQLGEIDYLVHCAAIMPAIAVVNETPGSVERLTNINYLGTINIIEAGIKPMIARNRGKAVIFGSVAGDAIVPNMASYCASKAAVNAYTESLIQELKIADSKVQVSLVKPPAVNTPLVDQTLATETPGSILSAKETGRLADPNSIVEYIEKQVAKGKNMIYPGSARFLSIWHFLLPGLWWKTVGSFEKK